MIAGEVHSTSTLHAFSSTISLAVEAVKDGHSQCCVAEEYGIPRSTLGDHVRGKVLSGAKSGNPKYLTDAEEAELHS